MLLSILVGWGGWKHFLLCNKGTRGAPCRAKGLNLVKGWLFKYPVAGEGLSWWSDVISVQY